MNLVCEFDDSGKYTGPAYPGRSWASIAYSCRMTIWIIISAVLAIMCAYAVRNVIYYRRKAYRLAHKVVGGSIGTITPPELDPVFEFTEHGFARSTAVLYIGRGSMSVIGATSDYEAWILAVLAKRASRIFEFGTCTGRTTYLMAANAADDSTVTTLTLPPADRDTYRTGEKDSMRASDNALAESAFTSFLYSGSDVEHKVRQLFMDSKQLDVAEHDRQYDLIFVDGSHAYSYVRSDTEKAMRMIRPGGIIAWHDYRGAYGDTKDVYIYLNELAATRKLKLIEGTSLVVYRHEG